MCDVGRVRIGDILLIEERGLRDGIGEFLRDTGRRHNDGRKLYRFGGNIRRDRRKLRERDGRQAAE